MLSGLCRSCRCLAVPVNLEAQHFAISYEQRKIQELSFDVLIALTARSIGATVITLNGQDFEDIQRHRRFRFLRWE